MATKDKLTALGVKDARLPEGKNQQKISDGRGLYLLVTPGGKYWRMNYRFGKKQRTLYIGVYPQMSLKEARDKRDHAHKLLEQNIDPSENKQIERRKAIARFESESFESVAREMFDKKRKRWSENYTQKTISRLERHIFPSLGKRRVGDIEAPDVLAALRKVEDTGAIEMAHRLKMLVGQVFRYAIATGRAKSDPSRDLKGALEPLVTTHYATIVEPKKVGALLRAIEGFEGTFVVKSALTMTPYVFTRPGELRRAEWSEIDWEAKEWRIPAEKMKMGEMHIVPLSKQVLAILKEIHAFTGDGKYVFPSIRNLSRPMSENTINASLRRIGYEKSEMCAHGFRAMASTLLHEKGWYTDIIERQLAHKEGNAIKGAYNHARHLPERKKMMQEWADYLDELRG